MDLTLFINLIVNQVRAHNKGVAPTVGKDFVNAVDIRVGFRVFLKKAHTMYFLEICRHFMKCVFSRRVLKLNLMSKLPFSELC